MSNLQRNDDGTLPAYAWPGGYPLFYMTQDSAVMCPACANGENGSLAKENELSPTWNLVAADVYWEGPNLECDHCNGTIESAYGEPDAQEETTP